MFRMGCKGIGECAKGYEVSFPDNTIIDLFL